MYIQDSRFEYYQKKSNCLINKQLDFLYIVVLSTVVNRSASLADDRHIDIVAHHSDCCDYCALDQYMQECFHGMRIIINLYKEGALAKVPLCSFGFCD